MKKEPYIIDFRKIGTSRQGYISIAEKSPLMPFAVKRVFWTYYTPEDVIRGRHAHYKTQLILIAAAGKISVHTEMNDNRVADFILEKPWQGLYLPPKTWHTMQYSHNAVQLVIASTTYAEKDYVRKYSAFKKM